MTKILFIIRDFKQGGIPRCLESLLQVIDSDRFKIDLLCLYQEGPYKGKMTNCNVIPQDILLLRLLSFGKNTSFIKSPVIFLFKTLNFLMGKLTGKNLLERRIKNIAKSLSGKYDIVIAYSEGICAQIAQIIVCEKRLVWIHNDYAFECARGDNNTQFAMFDSIICVSKASEKSFVSVFPQFKHKVCTIYNIINIDYIVKSALNGKAEELNNEQFNILSIGRICYQKNFRIIPNIISSIPIEFRKYIHWYIIGDGPENEVDLVRSEISKFELNDYCTLLGSRENPYPYLKQADLFVLTSLYESYPTVVNEALVLGTPIISVDIPPVYEMLDKDCIVPVSDIPNSIVKKIRNKTINDIKNNFFIESAKNHNSIVLSNISELFEK